MVDSDTITSRLCDERHSGIADRLNRIYENEGQLREDIRLIGLDVKELLKSKAILEGKTSAGSVLIAQGLALAALILSASAIVINLLK